MPLTTQVQTFLVGGAVRDGLLGLNVNDRDWVVVGSTPQALLDQGFMPVGADFPVFLHPTTQEEYALARTERKSGAGHRGFSVYFSPDVSLEEDLSRRDLTINAMAQSNSGELVDPHGGLADLRAKILRHVGPAFEEDPLRVLRVARFAARYVDFSIHPDTLALMGRMTAGGALSHLTAERVMMECQKAFEAPQPWRFFRVLNDIKGDLALFGQAFRVSAMEECLARPSVDQLPPLWRQALGFSKSGLTVFQTSSLSHRYKFSKELEYALQSLLHHGHEAHQISTNADAAWSVCKKLDGIRRPERFEEFLQTLESQGSFDFSNVRVGLQAVLGLHLGEQLSHVPNADKAQAVEQLRKNCFNLKSIRNSCSLGRG